MTPRTPRWVADTGYLLSFGAIAQGLGHLSDIFDGSLAAPQAVKAELVDIAQANRHKKATRDAAAKFLGRHADLLLDAPFTMADTHERDSVRAHLEGRTLPKTPAATTLASVDGVPPVTTGENAGESEAIPVCIRTKMPLLMNDGPATAYAQTRGVVVEPAAASLRRLSKLSTRQMFQTYLEMTKVNNGGAVVTGHLWFRQPIP